MASIQFHSAGYTAEAAAYAEASSGGDLARLTSSLRSDNPRSSPNLAAVPKGSYAWKRADFPRICMRTTRPTARGLGRPVIQNCGCRDDVDVLPPPPCRVRSSRRVDGNDAPISSRQSARNAEVLPICNLRLTAIIIRRLFDCNSGGSPCNNASLPSLVGRGARRLS